MMSLAVQYLNENYFQTIQINFILTRYIMWISNRYCCANFNVKFIYTFVQSVCAYNILFIVGIWVGNAIILLYKFTS